ncbi:MAG: hypothetical protein AB8G22_22375 [Saprospiraceae bacterium]
MYRRLDFIIAVILTFIVVIVNVRRLNKIYNDLTENRKVTVGVTNGLTYGGQTGRYINYEYCVGSKTYESKQHSSNWSSIDRNGGRFVLAYDSTKPELHFILFGMLANDSLCTSIDKKIEDLKLDYWDFIWNKGL